MQQRLNKLFTFVITHKRLLLPLAGLTFIFSLLPLHTADALVPLIIGGILATSLFFDIPIISDVVGAAAKPILEGLLAFFNIILGVIAAIFQAFYIGIGEIMHKIIKNTVENIN